jgi:23S rRNA (adenine2503-C2)-methyltransferase
MENILNKSLEELKQEFGALGLPAFRAKQVFIWSHKKLIFDFGLMTDLSKEICARLKEKYYLKTLRIKRQTTSKDGTKKYLMELADGRQVESVLLQNLEKRKTVCVSTQVGCPLACSFCATATLGFKRNLTVAEIIGQVYEIERQNPDISNVVFMGMGEPFLNYDNVLKSCRILIAPEGAGFGQRRITLSTCGLPEGIKKFADEDLQVRLAVSLNSALNGVRSKIMPINRKYPLEALVEAMKYYLQTTGRRITLEYVMLAGVNDRRSDLEALKKFCAGLQVSLNLIPFNPFGKKYRPSPLSTVEFFHKALLTEKINTIVRRSRGVDILAACGQLAGSAK